jgi:hypothetical protein
MEPEESAAMEMKGCHRRYILVGAVAPFMSSLSQSRIRDGQFKFCKAFRSTSIAGVRLDFALSLIERKSIMEIQPQEPGKDEVGSAPQMSELMKAHLDEVAGGIAEHGSWYSTH